ncbi:hypothetical protein LguiA_032559 [Lonicera macranthoides]
MAIAFPSVPSRSSVALIFRSSLFPFSHGVLQENEVSAIVLVWTYIVLFDCSIDLN